MEANQPKEYESPTTPGLKIAFNHFIVELICLNMDTKLGPRFWSGRNKKYWGPKYAREISKGLGNLLSKMDDFDLDDPIVRIGLIRAVQLTRVQTLLNKKNINRVGKRFHVEYKKLRQSHAASSSKPKPTIDTAANAKFVDPPQQSILRKIREIESSG